MSTKKILLIVGGIVVVLGFVVALFVGGIVLVAFTTIGKSEAAQTAKTFLQQNEKLKSDIGEVRDFGFWIKGSINTSDSDGEATLNLKVIGARKTVPASVNLAYRNGRDWVVVASSYHNDAGQTVNLLNPYEREAEAVGDEPDEAELDHSYDAVYRFDEESFSANVLRTEGTTLVVFVSKYSLDSQTLEATLKELSEDYAARQPRPL